MGTEKLDRKLDQVEIKQTSPIRFKDDAINKIRKQNIVWNKRTDIFIPFKVSKDSHQKGLKLPCLQGSTWRQRYYTGFLCSILVWR